MASQIHGPGLHCRISARDYCVAVLWIALSSFCLHDGVERDCTTVERARLNCGRLLKKIRWPAGLGADTTFYLIGSFCARNHSRKSAAARQAFAYQHYS